MRAPRSARRSARHPVPVLAGLLLAAALALTGCSGSADITSSSSGDAAAAQDGGALEKDAKEGAFDSGSDSRSGADEKAPGATRLPASHIIRTASLSVQVKDVPKALDEARTSAETAGGFVGSEMTTRDENGNEYTRVVLRVPVDSYEDVLADLEGTGKLLDRAAKATDVTDQVVDVESRIKTQRASVARIRELMDRATRLSDVVELEGELSSRQADLEALLAQQASLKDRTSLATITLSLSETPVKKPAEKDEDPGFTDALAGGWDAFVTMLRWIAVALAAVLPFAALAALLVLVWLRLVRPRGARRPATASTTTAPGPLPTARRAPEPGPAPAPQEEHGGQEQGRRGGNEPSP
ncbi:DUF4349 domain-containing protein [Streptomyces chromofuscus]|uniref:DUF4349 domain-containing protein n=1 Tax=Streptomyces chromofuscus TaxID=42881 RepID=A0A7M2T844_STRCW|nr:DUF4349 domain-containing protein [Streptomyces chromofuscus]QOV43591.1 DUF4349 domain-containing protein [Streptomyces chromofuscus]